MPFRGDCTSHNNYYALPSWSQSAPAQHRIASSRLVHFPGSPAETSGSDWEWALAFSVEVSFTLSDDDCALEAFSVIQTQAVAVELFEVFEQSAENTLTTNKMI